MTNEQKCNNDSLIQYIIIQLNKLEWKFCFVFEKYFSTTQMHWSKWHSTRILFSEYFYYTWYTVYRTAFNSIYLLTYHAVSCNYTKTRCSRGLYTLLNNTGVHYNNLFIEFNVILFYTKGRCLVPIQLQYTTAWVLNRPTIYIIIAHRRLSALSINTN